MLKTLTIRHSDIISNEVDTDATDFKVRTSARAVVFDDNSRVALLFARAHDYHKLPGGGVEADEDILKALERELIEEIGCDAEVIDEVGEVIEYRDQWQMKQISYCYLAKQIGNQQAPNFTQHEIDDGFEMIWAEDIDAAIALLESDTPSEYGEHFMNRRDLWLLNTARANLEHKK